MSGFFLLCLSLVLLSGLFFLVPPRRREQQVDADIANANLDWYRQRREELEAEGDEALLEDARLRLLEDEQGGEQGGAVPGSATTSHSGFPTWVLLPLLAAFSAGLYYLLGASTDVEITRRLNQMPVDAGPAEIQSLIAAIEARSAQRPDNLHYTALLGRYYMAQENYARAADLYRHIAEAVPEDAEAQAFAAQAAYLAAGRRLDDGARLRAEQALAADPHQRTALGLLGMASYEQGQYRAAIEYWERLLVMEPAGSESAAMIASVIDSARQKIAASGDDGIAMASADSAVVEASSPGVTVAVEFPRGADIKPTDTVFVLARSAAAGSRMPIAVQRFTAASLPPTLRLDDSNSMAGQRLSQAGEVVVAVQVSPSGQPGEANATWLGQAGPLAPSAAAAPVAIMLRPATAP